MQFVLFCILFDLGFGLCENSGFGGHARVPGAGGLGLGAGGWVMAQTGWARLGAEGEGREPCEICGFWVGAL